jgi:hypothetical protein
MFGGRANFERACISVGLYTRAGKIPFLLGCHKDNKTRMKVFEVYLNSCTIIVI